MIDLMTAKKPAGAKIIVNARIDAADVAKLDELATREGTVHYQRSRSELIAFAIREYIERHTSPAKPPTR